MDKIKIKSDTYETGKKRKGVDIIFWDILSIAFFFIKFRSFGMRWMK